MSLVARVLEEGGISTVTFSNARDITVSAFNPEWIAGHQGLAEGDEFAALGSGPINLLDDLRERRVALQPDWRNLRQSDY